MLGLTNPGHAAELYCTPPTTSAISSAPVHMLPLVYLPGVVRGELCGVYDQGPFGEVALQHCNSASSRTVPRAVVATNITTWRAPRYLPCCKLDSVVSVRFVSNDSVSNLNSSAFGWCNLPQEKRFVSLNGCRRCFENDFGSVSKCHSTFREQESARRVLGILLQTHTYA